jgi:hypothetical protein
MTTIKLTTRLATAGRLPLRTLLGSTLAAAGTASSMLLTAGGLTLLPATPAYAWWACPAGYTPTFQTRNNDTQVRCVRPEDEKAHDACTMATHAGMTVGTSIRRDYQQVNRDKCVGSVNGVDVIVVDPLCAGAGADYKLERRNGADRCVRPAEYAPPSRNV